MLRPQGGLRPACLKHGRRNAQRFFKSLALAFGVLRECVKVFSRLVLQSSEAGRCQKIRRRRFAVAHRKHSPDQAQFEAITLRDMCAAFPARHQLRGGLRAKMFGRRRISLMSALLIRFQQALNFLVFDNVVAQRDAFVADEDGGASNEAAHVMLALAAERAMEDRFLWRGVLPRSGRKRGVR